MWMQIRWFGVDGMAARLREHVRLARLLASWIDADPAWERLAPVPFSTVCLRYREGDDLDAINELILGRVNASGKVFLSHTKLAGRYTLLEQRDSVELMSEAQRRGVKILIAGPYNSGLLADAAGPGETYDYQPVDSSVRDRARRIYSLCAQEGVDVGAAALQFPLAHPAVANVVAGLRSRQEVLTAARRLSDHIPVRLWGHLQKAGLLAAGAAVPET